MDAGTNDRVFHYHADASPFGGNLTTPLAYTISTQASSSLSEGGGHVHASVGNYEVMSAISVDSAVSEIYGLPNDSEQVWETHVTSTVRGLNILDIVKVDALTCKYMVKHPYDEGTYYPSVDFTECSFGNVQVNGAAVTPIVDTQQFSRSAADVVARGGCWLEDPVLVDRVCTQNAALCGKAPGWVNVRYGWVPDAAARQKKGHVVCSLVQGFTGFPDSRFLLKRPSFLASASTSQSPKKLPAPSIASFKSQVRPCLCPSSPPPPSKPKGSSGTS